MKLTKKLLISLFAFVLASCGGELTEIVVSVDVTAGVPCVVDTLVVRVSERGQMVETVIDPQQLPATVSIVWEGGSKAALVEAVGLKGTTEVLTVSADVTFVEGQSSLLPMTLAETCTSGCTAQVAGAFNPDSLPAAAGTRSCECPPENPRCNDAPVTEYEATVDSFARHTDACDLPGAIDVIVNGDDVEVEAPQTIQDLLAGDFQFYYFGERVTNMFIGDDGYIGLGSAAPGLRPSAQDIKPGPLDGGSLSPRTVFPFWDNLELQGAGKVCIGLTQTVPRTILVSWSKACFKSGCASGDDLNFSASFEENEDTIKFTYGTMSSQDPARALGSFAVSGVVGNTKGTCDASMCDLSGQCPDGSSCGFTQLFSLASQEALPARSFEPVQ